MRHNEQDWVRVAVFSDLWPGTTLQCSWMAGISYLKSSTTILMTLRNKSESFTREI